MTPAAISRRSVIGAPVLLAGCRKRSSIDTGWRPQ